MKRCPHCNGRVTLLGKRAIGKLTRDSIKIVKVKQFYRCKRCKKEMEA